jgi:hypothetical protein
VTAQKAELNRVGCAFAWRIIAGVNIGPNDNVFPFWIAKRNSARGVPDPIWTARPLTIR